MLNLRGVSRALAVVRYSARLTGAKEQPRTKVNGRLGAVMGCPPGGPARLLVAIMPTLEDVVARVVEGLPAG